MAECAKEAKRQRQALESALQAGNAALLKHVEKINGLWGGISRSREGFLNAGGRLSQAFNITDYPRGWSNEKIKVEGDAGNKILEELKSQELDLNDVLMSIAEDNRRSVVRLEPPQRDCATKTFRLDDLPGHTGFQTS
jgi:hypothetical protein